MASVTGTVRRVCNTLITQQQKNAEQDPPGSGPIVYLMRGLPSCGKSYTARRLAGDEGIVIETDEFFYKQVGDEQAYQYDANLLDMARNWSVAKFAVSLQEERSPIVVDRGNGRNAESKIYIQLALEHDYDVRIAEPTSTWWSDIKTLLRYRPHTDAILDEWAYRLAKISRETHNVPVHTIRDWMDAWWDDLTIDDILSLDDPTQDLGHLQQLNYGLVENV